MSDMLNLQLTQGKYKETYLARVGGPDGPEAVVTCLTLGPNNAEPVDVNLVMEVSDMRAMVYNTLRATQHIGPVSAELYEAFQSVFKRQADAKNESESVQADPEVAG